MMRYKHYIETMAYRFYVTDTLYYSARSEALTIRYSEMIKPEPKDTRSGDEIAMDVIHKLGLKV